MTFLETPRFPANVSYGATGGPGYKTNIVIVNSGHEKRNITWAVARASYDVSHAARTKEKLYELIHFFRSVKGRAYGFRFKDWSDYQVSDGEGFLGDGVADGLLTSYQMIKKYETGVLSEERTINKPVQGTVTVYRNGAPVTEGAAPGNVTIDYTSGLVTFIPDEAEVINANIARTIIGITLDSDGNPIIETSVAHGFVAGDKLKTESVGGMIQLNGNYYDVLNVPDGTHVTLDVDASAFGAYTSGGTITKYGITQTNPARVYLTGHTFTNGQKVRIMGVGGMTQINDLAYAVVNANADYFDLSGVDATAFSARTTGGSAELYPDGDTLTWTGEFDVPCRFDTDQIRVDVIAPGVQGWGQIPIVEIRV